MEIKGFVLDNISPIRNGKIRRIFFINGMTSRDVHVLKILLGRRVIIRAQESLFWPKLTMKLLIF
jgi:hypothetical protein